MFVGLVGCALTCVNGRAQVADPDAPSLLSEVPSVPGISAKLKGLNGGVTLTAVHDSQTGWYTLVTPAMMYSMGTHFSVDVSMPVYLYRLAEDETTVTVSQPAGPPGSPPAPPVQTTTVTSLKPHTWDPGDVVLAAHGNWMRRWLSYTLTPSMTLPSGDSDHGLSTGRVTFDVDNHFQAATKRATFVLGIGAGDSSNLVNRLVTKDYTSLGPLAHFQAGLMVPMRWRTSFQSVAYEQLPMGDTKIYQTLTRPGYPPIQVVSGRSVSEDNGFTNSLIVPVTNHLSLQGYYNRSLRLHLDTVAMGITFVARGTKPVEKRKRSLVDGLLGESK